MSRDDAVPSPVSPTGETSSAAVRVCALDDIAPGQAKRFDVAGLKVAVVRIGDDVYALGDTCSHANVSLSEGEVLTSDREIECWKHGSTFSLLDGQPQSLPATQPVPVYQVTLDGSDVLVRLS